MNETIQQRSARILSKLREKYPGKDCFDVDGRGMHFAAEIEPTEDHPEYDVAVEIIYASKAHKHLKIVQQYKIISGNLELHDGDKVVFLKSGDVYTIQPGNVHYAKSEEGCLLEELSRPGWTKEDHIWVDL